MYRGYLGLFFIQVLLYVSINSQIQFRASSLPKSKFVSEIYHPELGPYSFAREKQNIKIDFGSSKNYVELESSFVLDNGHLIDLYIIKTRKYTYDLNILNNYYNHILICVFADRIDVYTRDFTLLSRINSIPDMVSNLKKSKQKFKMTEDQKSSLKIEHVQCEKFQMNTLNCITILEPLSIVLHWKFSIKVLDQRSKEDIIYKEIKIQHKVHFLAPIQRLLKGSLMINGSKNTRKWDRDNMDFKTKHIDLFLGPPKELSDLIISITGTNGYFL